MWPAALKVQYVVWMFISDGKVKHGIKTSKPEDSFRFFELIRGFI
ncbi:hypothetical protein SAMN04488519_102257 [Algoriphagus ornithinivorans]|uniref:Uncharacterized protein n=1 Tax=Algoriphagus ornithinivorans TaxID=226506 RepID=A0A1I5CFG9_9BACT|nr:hypothetical protein SAMN04488519_102257 [Algoriphagus ornithinivorans]